MTVLLNARQRWECPNCPVTAATVGASNRFHYCRGLNGIYAPMVLAGTRCEITAVERQDWIRGELVQYDGAGRPIMSVITTRDDGQDVVVYAPTARGQGMVYQ